MLYIRNVLKSFENQNPFKNTTKPTTGGEEQAGDLVSAQAGTQNSPTSASHMLILQAWATMFGLKKNFF